MMFLNIVIGIAVILCAVQAIRSNRLLISAIWLAGASALTALILYLLGAYQVAVIELSVGAGLVTVLFVFAINISGEEVFKPRRLIPKPFAAVVALLVSIVLVWFTWGTWLSSQIGVEILPFHSVLWEIRGIDIILQGLLIFTGVLAVLGLMEEGDKDSQGEVHP